MWIRERPVLPGCTIAGTGDNQRALYGSAFRVDSVRPETPVSGRTLARHRDVPPFSMAQAIENVSNLKITLFGLRIQKQAGGLFLDENQIAILLQTWASPQADSLCPDNWQRPAQRRGWIFTATSGPGRSGSIPPPGRGIIQSPHRCRIRGGQYRNQARAEALWLEKEKYP